MYEQKDRHLADENVGQYLVVQTGKLGPVSIRMFLKNYPDVAILDELDSSTALVEMSEQTRQQLTQEFPDLAVEPNLRYKAAH